MKGTKRRRSRSPTSSRKSPRVNGDDEDLELILEQIRQQEESEALARKLQSEAETAPVAEVIDLTVDGEVNEIAGDQGTTAAVNSSIGSTGHEDDEAMARRLAREWGELDAMEKAGTNADVKTGRKSPHKTTLSHSPPSSSSRRIMSGQSASNVAYREPGATLINPQDDLFANRDIFIRTRACTKCGKDVESPRNLVVFSKTIPPPTLLALLHCVCGACGQSHCRGCFSSLTCAKNCKGKHCSVVSCCAEVRAIAIFEALGGFDRQYLGEQRNASAENPKPSKPRQKVATVGPGGTGYSTSRSDDAAPRYGGDTSQLTSLKAIEASKAVAARWDDVVLRALDTITWLLPSPYSDTAAAYDILPHPSIKSLISISYLPELLRGLLINDSVTDWTDRNDVYNSMLNLLRRMADSELSVGALIDQRMEKKKSPGLEDWMWGNGTVEWEIDSKSKAIIRAPPLLDHFKKLTKQCETFLAGASHLFEDGKDGEIEDMAVRATSLCGDMISARDDMQRALSVMGRVDSVFPAMSTGKGKGRDGDVEMEKRYCVSCEELAFKHVALSNASSSKGLSYSAFHYSLEVQQTENSTRNPSRRLHLVRELSVISTSLPPGVWVRVDEVRNDVIKIMIAGPEGTPYAGGLFEFDCFMPLEYPNIPPKMNLCTTASGSVRFNPNLYEDGKVCLSLLGTWPGRPEEQWSSKSTLLQVIVSIQSMIMVDAPFFNEPGYGIAKPSDPRSISYNKNIALQTVRWAMVDWMQEKHRGGIWSDVIANHFSIRYEKILGRIRTWAKNDNRFQNYSPSTTELAGSESTAPSRYQYPSQPMTKEQQKNNLPVEFERGCKLVQGWLKN